MLLSRSVRGLSLASRGAGPRLVAAHSVRCLATSTSSSGHGYHAWGFAAGATAAVALASTVAVCEQAKETSASASAPVDYAQLRKDIADLLESNSSYDDGSYGPVLVRLAWHAAGSYDGTKGATCPGGSNGATMRFKPESEFGANAGLAVARQVLEPLKAKYPGVSYADLWTLAGVVAIEEMGGPVVPWREGRTDAKDGTSCPPDGRLPDAAQGAQHVRDIFYRMGFNDKEIVALLGAHAVGRCHPNRSGFTGPWTNAPTTFSNEFFRLLLEEKWTEKKWNGPKQYEDKTGKLMMLPTDMALIEDPKFKYYVEYFAKDEAAFFKEFSKAFKKLLEAGVKYPCKGWWAWLFGY